MGDDTLKTQIQTQMTEALKAGDKVRLGALRMLSAAITNSEKDVMHDLRDDEVREVAGEGGEEAHRVDRGVRGSRPDRARRQGARGARRSSRRSRRAQLDEEATDALIDEAFAATGASTPQEMGKVMGFVMGKAKGQRRRRGRPAEGQGAARGLSSAGQAEPPTGAVHRPRSRWCARCRPRRPPSCPR